MGYFSTLNSIPLLYVHPYASATLSLSWWLCRTNMLLNVIEFGCGNGEQDGTGESCGMALECKLHEGRSLISFGLWCVPVSRKGSDMW